MPDSTGMRQVELIEYIAKALVDDPQSVVVRESDTQVGTLELKVAGDDRGKVIGRKGRTAHAMRVLLAASSEPGEPFGLDIVDA